MATIIDELMIKLGVDGKDAKAGINNINASMDSFVSGVKGKLASLTASFAGLYAVQQTFSTYLNEADSLLKFSRAIGQNVEEVDAWGQAVERSGGSAEGFRQSLKSMTLQLSKMATTGNSRAGKILESVGIDAGEVGRQRKAFDVFMDIADKMQTMSKEEAFGFGSSLGLGVGEISLLQQGRDGVADLVGKMKELGTITPDDTWVEDFNDGVADVKKSFMSLSAVVFRLFGPGLKQVVVWFKELNIWLRKHETAVKAFAIGVAGIITAILMPAIGAFFLSLLTNPITYVILALAGLALAIEDLIVWTEGGESAMDDLWESLYGDRETAKKSIEETKQNLVQLWKDAQEAWQTFKEDILPGLKVLWSAIKTVCVWMKNLNDFLKECEVSMTGHVIPAVAMFEIAWHYIKMAVQWVEDKVNEFWAFVTGVVSDLMAWFENLGNTIMTAIGQAVDWAKGKLAELKQEILNMPVVGGAVQFGLDAYDAVTGGGNVSSVDTKIGQITVNTQATDAGGIASAIGGATRKTFGANKSNGGAI